MKKYAATLTFVFSFIVLTAVASQAQLAEEQRPFDFTDKHYISNGVIPELLIGRKNGADGESVFDQASELRYNNVRVTATYPGYAGDDGVAMFWNYYAGVPKYAFTEDVDGQHTVATAFAFPLYFFPSATVKESDRQAAFIRTDDGYYEKNPLGISAVLLVEFTDKIDTKKGRAVMEMLAKRNGRSLDGTPIIRTAKEIDSLVADGFLSLTQPGLDEPYRTPFAIARIIRFPETGGITPDAFLKYVKEPNGDPLDSEEHFVTTFECVKGGEKCS